MKSNNTTRGEIVTGVAAAKRQDAEEMIAIYLKLPETARERIRYMTEGAALTAERTFDNLLAHSDAAV